MLHDHDGNLLDVGRRHRLATPALRRAVRERDKGRCQFPGCNTGLADKLDLDMALWTCFANARIDAEQASQHQDHEEPELAA